MNGFRRSRVIVVVALTAAVLTGCASSRRRAGGGDCCRDSSSGERVPARRTETTRATHETPSEKLTSTCPVTGQKLGSMGPPVSVTVNGRTIQVCCDACVAKVQQNPDKYLTDTEDVPALAQESSARQAAFDDQPSTNRGSRSAAARSSGGCQSCR